MRTFRKCRFRTGEILVRPSFTFIPTRNGRSALFTIPASRPSFPRRGRTSKRMSRPPMPPLPQSGRHLHNCNRQASYPMPKSENRSCNANAKLQRNAPPRLHSLQRGKCNLAGLATACGERLDGSYRPFETMSLTLSIGHAGCGWFSLFLIGRDCSGRLLRQGLRLRRGCRAPKLWPYAVTSP